MRLILAAIVLAIAIGYAIGGSLRNFGGDRLRRGEVQGRVVVKMAELTKARSGL